MNKDNIAHCCEHCIHKQIFKHKEEYQEASHNIGNEAATYEDIFNISVCCKFFDESTVIFR